jgi:glutamate:GABA antiporter
MQPALKRELGLRDTTLFAISCIVGTRWIAAAAHAGPGSVTLWAATALFFVIPLALAVASLATRYPESGGLYIWTRNDFGQWHGFLAFWLYWVGLAVWFPSAAIFYMSAALHALGMPVSRPYVLTAALLAIVVALGTNLIGMKIGKWTENIGGTASWAVTFLFVILAAIVWMKRGSATPLTIVPAFDWGTVSLWATIAYGMSGMELVGGMVAEIRDPQRTLPRAGWLASGCITLFYSTATIALVVLLQPSRISEMNGLAEAGDEAARVLGLGWLGPLIALLVVASGMGQLGGIGTSMSRLPFAAGADGLLPAAFGRIHPRWRTPHVSILSLGAISIVLLFAVQLGDSLRAAYDVLVSLMVLSGFIPFFYIFGSSWKAGNRISAAAGTAVVVATLVFSLVPTADITNVWLFEGKVLGGLLLMAGTAWAVYRRRRGI